MVFAVTSSVTLLLFVVVGLDLTSSPILPAVKSYLEKYKNIWCDELMVYSTNKLDFFYLHVGIRKVGEKNSVGQLPVSFYTLKF